MSSQRYSQWPRQQKQPKRPSVDEWQTRVACPYRRVLLGPEEERNTGTGCHTDDPWEHGAQWKATYCLIPFTGNVQNRQVDRDGKVDWRLPSKGRCGISFREEERVPKLTVGMVVPLFEYSKNHWIVRFKWVNYMPHESYLKKAVK